MRIFPFLALFLIISVVARAQESKTYYTDTLDQVESVIPNDIDEIRLYSTQELMDVLDTWHSYNGQSIASPVYESAHRFEEKRVRNLIYGGDFSMADIELIEAIYERKVKITDSSLITLVVKHFPDFGLDSNATFTGSGTRCGKVFANAVLFYKSGKPVWAVKACFGCSFIISYPYRADIKALNFTAEGFYYFRNIRFLFADFGIIPNYAGESLSFSYGEWKIGRAIYEQGRSLKF